MALFNFGRKRNELGATGCSSVHSVSVLGTGCKTCHRQLDYVREAVETLELGVEVEYVADMERIMEYGAIGMPAITVNGRIVASGRLLKPAEVRKLLEG